MKKKLFISGSIQGMEANQEYRITLAKICDKMGVDVIDPWSREKTLQLTI